MRRKNLFALILLFLPVSLLPAANDWVRQQAELIINGQFEEARNILKSDEAEADPLLNSFYLANWYHARFSDQGYPDQEAVYTDLLQEVIRLSDQRLAGSGLNDSETSRVYFYRGSALGLLAFYFGEQKDWWEALRYGQQSVSDLEKSLQIDSTQIEARLGIGVYLYWRSRKTTWIPFMEDRSREAISLISSVAGTGSPSQAMAAHQLIYILLDAGRYQDAENLAQKWCSVYPESVFMKWARAHTYYKMKNNQKAAAAYREIIHLLLARKEAPSVQIFDARLKLFEVLIRLGDKTECRREKENLDSLIRSKNILRYRADKLQKIMDLQAACEDF